jgi:hypothetical protein
MTDAVRREQGLAQNGSNTGVFSMDSRFTIPVQVRHITDDEGATILDFRRDQHVTLNSTGGRLWALVVAGYSVREMADVLAQEYRVPAATALSDASDLLSQLMQLGIIEGSKKGL